MFFLSFVLLEFISTSEISTCVFSVVVLKLESVIYTRRRDATTGAVSPFVSLAKTELPIGWQHNRASEAEKQRHSQTASTGFYLPRREIESRKSH